MMIGERKVKICCMNLAIAVRIIGLLGILVSLTLVIIMTMSFAKAGNYLMAYKSDLESIMIVICLLSYFCVCLLSSALLIYASIVKKWVFTVQWLFLMAIGFVLQMIAMIILISNTSGTAAQAKYFSISFFGLVVTVYFWLCVLFAALEWKEESNNQRSPTPHDNCRVGFDNRQVVNSV